MEGQSALCPDPCKYAGLFVELGCILQHGDMSHARFRAFMHLPPTAAPNSCFKTRARWQRRWQTPPDDVVFAECLSQPQDAPAVTEEISQFLSACSELDVLRRVFRLFEEINEVDSAPEPRLTPKKVSGIKKVSGTECPDQLL